jgi:hypothetical protein
MSVPGSFASPAGVLPDPASSERRRTGSSTLELPRDWKKKYTVAASTTTIAARKKDCISFFIVIIRSELC